jgi:thiamine biosynthesis protein ThiS
MKIILNGEEVKLEGKISVSSLIDKYSLDKRKIAVERNLEIVPRSSFEEVLINEGDRIEIIHFIGGG